jgi:hypothetical protein
MPELSASSQIGRSLSGRTRTGADVISSLSFMKESSWGRPVEPNILHGEIKQCACMMGEARDELTVTKPMKD